MQAIDRNTREVVICEGELDALSLWDFGWPANSVPSGAGGMTWIENDFDHLERFDTIHLCFDQDEAGQKHIEAVAERLPEILQAQWPLTCPYLFYRFVSSSRRVGTPLPRPSKASQPLVPSPSVPETIWLGWSGPS